ncbi:MAG: hypothetical protein QF660_03040 [Anaerolineales bacterium]|nr:hypothetical protein [Anaerolineales bacterium]
MLRGRLRPPDDCTNSHDGSERSVFFFRPYTGQIIWGASARMILALLK